MNSDNILLYAKEYYQLAIMEIEGIGVPKNTVSGMRRLKAITKMWPHKGFIFEEVRFWWAVASQKLGELYYNGVEGVMPPDPLRAHKYFMFSHAHGNKKSLIYLGLLYRQLCDVYHAAMYLKAVVDGHLEDAYLAQKLLEELKEHGFETDIPMDEYYPEEDMEGYMDEDGEDEFEETTPGNFQTNA